MHFSISLVSSVTSCILFNSLKTIFPKSPWVWSDCWRHSRHKKEPPGGHCPITLEMDWEGTLLSLGTQDTSFRGVSSLSLQNLENCFLHLRTGEGKMVESLQWLGFRGPLEELFSENMWEPQNVIFRKYFVFPSAEFCPEPGLPLWTMGVLDTDRDFQSLAGWI